MGPATQPLATAVQLVTTPAELQVRTLLLPLAIVGGLAEIDTTGGLGGLTETWALAALLVPPAPVQVSEKLAFALSVPVDLVPLVASAPLQPPLAWQAVALVEVQLSVDVPPTVTDVGFAVSVAVGTTLTVTDTVELEPPAPLQTIENVVLVVIATVA
jgi:hypothetical protein